MLRPAGPTGAAPAAATSTATSSCAAPRTAPVEPTTVNGAEKLTLGNQAYQVEVGFDAAWIQLRAPDQVLKVDQATGDVSLSVAGGIGVAIGHDAVWVSTTEQQLVKIDPVSCETLLSVPAEAAVYFAVGLGSVWAPVGNGDLLRYDEETGDLLATIKTDKFLKNVAVSDDAAWATAKDDGKVLRIDPATNAVIAEISVFDQPQDVVVDPHGVWVTHDAGAGTVTLIDPATNDVVRTVDGVGSDTGIAAGGGYLWVTSSNAGVSRIDPESFKVTAVFEVTGESNYALAYDEELWVTSRSGWVYRVPLPAS